MDDKEDIGKEEVRVPSSLVYNLMQHPFQSLIQPLHKLISLRVVDRRSQMFDLHHPT